MTNIITPQMIENTKAFQTLPKFKRPLILKRENRSIIENAFIHYNKTKIILPQIGNSNIEILKEIIESHET